ncbi:hypothetical protein [Desulfofundulus thermosubterraneus]|nr:hypothetical protein [Desulfofundulus thermosubterraneus]
MPRWVVFDAYVLIDGEKLAELMIEYGVGVTEVARYSLKRIDSDYFEEEQ